MRKEFCSDEGDAVHLLNRMLRRGLMHHCSLNKLMENNGNAYYRFPQDHFKVVVFLIQLGVGWVLIENALEMNWIRDTDNLISHQRGLMRKLPAGDKDT